MGVGPKLSLLPANLSILLLTLTPAFKLFFYLFLLSESIFDSANIAHRNFYFSFELFSHGIAYQNK